MKKNISVDSGNEASSEDSNDSTTRLDFSTLQFTIVHLSALSTVHYYTAGVTQRSGEIVPPPVREYLTALYPT